jgi:hypothetical protein
MMGFTQVSETWKGTLGSSFLYCACTGLLTSRTTWAAAPADAKPTQKEIAAWFSAKFHPISQSTVSDSLKPTYDYLDTEKKLTRHGEAGKVDTMQLALDLAEIRSILEDYPLLLISTIWMKRRFTGNLALTTVWRLRN